MAFGAPTQALLDQRARDAAVAAQADADANAAAIAALPSRLLVSHRRAIRNAAKFMAQNAVHDLLWDVALSGSGLVFPFTQGTVETHGTSMLTSAPATASYFTVPDGVGYVELEYAQVVSGFIGRLEIRALVKRAAGGADQVYTAYSNTISSSSGATLNLRAAIPVSSGDQIYILNSHNISGGYTMTVASAPNMSPPLVLLRGFADV